MPAFTCFDVDYEFPISLSHRPYATSSVIWPPLIHSGVWWDLITHVSTQMKVQIQEEGFQQICQEMAGWDRQEGDWQGYCQNEEVLQSYQSYCPHPGKMHIALMKWVFFSKTRVRGGGGYLLRFIPSNAEATHSKYIIARSFLDSLLWLHDLFTQHLRLNW